MRFRGLGIGLRMGPGIASKGQSLSSYWRQQSEVLFFGEISKISDGKLYNQKSGATDYLTVTGSPGSYTFQCPNTAAYIAADTDYIWFKTNGVQRTATTEAELVSYDLQRTPVKYGDVSPNSIEAIIILNSDVTGSKLDRLFSDMHLSIYWNGIFNDNGYLKDNRVGQQLWTPESAFFNSEAEALVNRMIAAGEEPDATRKTLIDTTWTALKSKAFYTKMDAIWCLAAHATASARMNWIENDHNCTLINAPTFTIGQGFSCTTIGSKALATDFIPSTDGVNFLQNSASMGYYSRSESNAASYSMGASTGTVFTYLGNYMSSKVQSIFNNAVASYFANPASTSAGLVISTRTSSTSITNYKGTTGSTSGSISSNGVPANEIYIGACNDDGVYAQGKIVQMAFAFAGGALDATDVADIKEVFVDGYLTSIGAAI